MSHLEPVDIDGRRLGASDDTYVIAEIGSNFDGSKQRAEELIELAAECGADAAKFQAFTAEKILSERGFQQLQAGFQENWEKSVTEVYRDAELPREWIDDLAARANEEGVDFLCTPYDYEAADLIEAHVPAYKVGSGDITWHSFLRYVAEKGKPIILATGASTLAEVDEAVEVIRSAGNDDIILLQCVTNYPSEFESANVRAMDTLRDTFEVPAGYSDHTPGSVVPLAAVSRGACVIEKHFTDDKSRDGPDHPHSMDPDEFRRMVTGIRNLEEALGSRRKRLYDEEVEDETVVAQRRCLRAAVDIEPGTTIADDMLVSLRPAPREGLTPKYREHVVGRVAAKPLEKGEAVTWDAI